MTLQDISKDKDNNVNFIRFLAAMMVVFCHVYPLSIGWGDCPKAPERR